ncbi:Histidinol-phosphate aminotransferase [invertebrate metagenome]|uniref:Histidinol-phosphate aminotransferase n=1 Tax=invertebrate metagenome TaxID=1711999 RepID=A0A2H9T8M0_9ZZZZ
MHDFLEQAAEPVRSIEPYQPGKPVDELAREWGIRRENIVKLASNENPLGPSPMALQALTETLKHIARYPDGDSFLLKQALADHYQMFPQQVTVGNGSNDLLVLMAEAFLSPGFSAIFSQYAFMVYKSAVAATGARGIEVPAAGWGHDLEIMTTFICPQTRLIFLANPNNPTGTYFSHDDLKRFMEKVPETVIVILDEAYVEYVEEADFPNSIALMKRFSNLVIVRTFSKIFGLAGCRVGYCLSDSSIARVINRIRQSFNVNSLAQSAAKAALKDETFLTKSRNINQAGKIQLANGLERLGKSFIPSAGNFICMNVGFDVMPLYQKLLRRGVIVRPLVNYCMPHHLRISIGLPDENSRFLSALEASLNE